MAALRESFVIALALCLCVRAQQAPVPTPSPTQLEALHKQDVGLESPAEARGIVSAVLRNDDQIKPILAKIDPKGWYENRGAPAVYVIQWQTAQRQVDELDVSARAYQASLEDLSAGLDFYFRLEALDFTARSLYEGTQRYDNRATAADLATFVAHNFDDRERFRQYLRGVAQNLQQSFKIADAEAQRCRTELARQTPCAASKKRSK